MDANDFFYPKDAKVAIIDGAVVPVGTQPITPAEIVEHFKSLAALPYMGNDVEKMGMTLVEAAIYSDMKKAADGDGQALTRVLDRIVGKPIQQVANLNMTTSLKEFLDNVARTDESPTTDVDPFSV